MSMELSLIHIYRVWQPERQEQPRIEIESAIAELQLVGRFEHPATHDVSGAGDESKS